MCTSLWTVQSCAARSSDLRSPLLSELVTIHRMVTTHRWCLARQHHPGPGWPFKRFRNKTNHSNSPRSSSENSCLSDSPQPVFRTLNGYPISVIVVKWLDGFAVLSFIMHVMFFRFLFMISFLLPYDQYQFIFRRASEDDRVSRLGWKIVTHLTRYGWKCTQSATHSTRNFFGNRTLNCIIYY